MVEGVCEILVMSKEIFFYIFFEREEFSRFKLSLGINFGCIVVIVNIIEGVSVKDLRLSLVFRLKCCIGLFDNFLV